AACSPDHGPRFRAAGNPAPRAGGVLRYSTNLNVRTLDPAIAYDDVSTPLIHPIFDTLVDYAPAVEGGLDLIPRLAEHWTVSPDGLVYTFAIRRGVEYSDGTPLVAADFKFAIERVRAMADSPFGAFVADVTAIEVPGDHELRIRLSAPNAAFI